MRSEKHIRHYCLYGSRPNRVYFQSVGPVGGRRAWRGTAGTIRRPVGGMQSGTGWGPGEGTDEFGRRTGRGARREVTLQSGTGRGGGARGKGTDEFGRGRSDEAQTRLGHPSRITCRMLLVEVKGRATGRVVTLESK